MDRPQLLYFFSPRDGRSRKVESFVAQALQRRRNHHTFTVRRIDVTERPDLAARFRVGELPVLCVVENRRVAARIDAPRGGKAIVETLDPWLREP
jgi:thioredoxin-like negative regulator of GroEL